MPNTTQHVDTLYYHVQRSKWFRTLDKRQGDDILFCVLYFEDFGHGAEGHHRMCTVAKLAEMLTKQEEQVHG